jgi:hypothetical protein
VHALQACERIAALAIDDFDAVGGWRQYANAYAPAAPVRPEDGKGVAVTGAEQSLDRARIGAPVRDRASDLP